MRLKARVASRPLVNLVAICALLWVAVIGHEITKLLVRSQWSVVGCLDARVNVKLTVAVTAGFVRMMYIWVLWCSNNAVCQQHDCCTSARIN